ncbi:hypothetical protein SSX86_032696 [Deinandra increscens subsp. villosa]|uniref:BHLH domain-containing protein n=1 Tax=Deinandra increscens subsp. villosa TaxID=3103831 RepID=A0AAP0C2Y9_9ASTR
MMGENPNYWWSLNGKLQLPPPSQQAYNPTFLSTPQLPLPLLPVPPPSSILNPPYLFGSSLLVPAANPNPLADHHHQENQDFPVSWSHLLLSGLASDQEQHNLGAAHAGEQKYGYLDNQQSRQLYYSNKSDHHGNNNSTEEDLQACSSSWSSQLPSVGSSSTMTLSTTTMFDFSSKIDTRNQHNQHTNQYSSQYDDTSTSGVSKKPRFQSTSTRTSSMEGNETFTTGTSKRARATPTQTPLKVRKEKLSDRISALHQLVSPFGKTDTASVLLEATTHIRFLEGQIETLSSPYMNLGNNVPGGTRHQHHTVDGKALSKDLASRGLCLVPVTNDLYGWYRHGKYDE